MQRLVRCVLVLAVAALAATPLAAAPVPLYVDSAPNVYGSGAYAAWWDGAKASVVAGTFQDMANGTYPGTHTFDPVDAIVYSTGDLGSRLQWIYWLEGQSVGSLAGRFEVRDVFDWDGVSYTYDWATSSLVEATADNGWSQPRSWSNHAGGVIGTFGDAWWATDNDALPFSTDASIYNEANAADIQALRLQALTYQTFWRGEVRYRDAPTAAWEYSALEVDVVPEPASMLLLGTGLVGLAGVARRRLRK